MWMLKEHFGSSFHQKKKKKKDGSPLCIMRVSWRVLWAMKTTSWQHTHLCNGNSYVGICYLILKTFCHNLEKGREMVFHLYACVCVFSFAVILGNFCGNTRMQMWCLTFLFCCCCLGCLDFGVATVWLTVTICLFVCLFVCCLFVCLFVVCFFFFFFCCCCCCCCCCLFLFFCLVCWKKKAEDLRYLY